MGKTKAIVKKGKAKNKPRKWRAVPLKGSFMAAAILGFFISAYMVYDLSVNYGVTFMVLFAVMFIAALISMTKAPAAEN